MCDLLAALIISETETESTCESLLFPGQPDNLKWFAFVVKWPPLEGGKRKLSQPGKSFLTGFSHPPHTHTSFPFSPHCCFWFPRRIRWVGRKSNAPVRFLGIFITNPSWDRNEDHQFSFGRQDKGPIQRFSFKGPSPNCLLLFSQW